MFSRNNQAHLAGRDLTSRRRRRQHNAAVFNSAGLIQSGGNIDLHRHPHQCRDLGPADHPQCRVSDTLLHAYDLISRPGCAEPAATAKATTGDLRLDRGVDQLVHQIVLQDRLAAGGADAKIRSVAT